jgi:phosphatidylcholine synthase
MTGALYFADRNMKTDDNYFRGFPTLWNAVAFYLFVLKPLPWIGISAIGLLAVLTFVPFKFVHPLRVTRLRMLTVTALALWSLLAAYALWTSLDPGPWVAAALAVIAVYFLAIGLTEKR